MHCMADLTCNTWCRQLAHTAAACAAAAALLANVTKGPELEAAAESCLKAVRLWSGGVADKPSGSYSGGMKRRLSVAISLMGDPKVVYLDEPSTVRACAGQRGSNHDVGTPTWYEHNDWLVPSRRLSCIACSLPIHCHGLLHGISQLQPLQGSLRGTAANHTQHSTSVRPLRAARSARPVAQVCMVQALYGSQSAAACCCLGLLCCKCMLCWECSTAAAAAVLTSVV
jgi:hypothetical protein